MRRCLLFCTTLILSAFAHAHDTYCNARFAFCIDHPSSLVASEESENSDGAYFRSPDLEADIRAYAHYNAAFDSFGEYVQSERQSHQRFKPSYKKAGKRSYTVSYKDKGEIIYIRHISIQNGAIATFYARYPDHEQAAMHSVINLMSRSLRAAGRSF